MTISLGPEFTITPVPGVRGIGLPNTSFDGRAAKFCRQLIFEFLQHNRPKGDIPPVHSIGVLAISGIGH